MQNPSIKRTAIIIGATLVCIALVWMLGFGFGHEARISNAAGIVLFGSEIYTGVWTIFILMSPIVFTITGLANKFLLSSGASEQGLALGDHRFGAIVILGMAPLYVLLPLSSSFLGTETYYTYLKNPAFLSPLNIAIHCASYTAFILGFEYLFRGFVLFGLIKALGDDTQGRLIAIAISTILMTVFLIGIPPVITIAMIGLAIPACLLNIRTKSIFYFAFINWNLGIWSDIWEIVKLNIAGIH